MTQASSLTKTVMPLPSASSMAAASSSRGPVVITPVTGSDAPLVSVDSQYDSLRKVAEKSQASLERNRMQMESAIDELRRNADSAGRSLGFHIDDAIDGPVITVRNSQTGEVIRQIPQEVVVRVAHSIDQLKGLLFDGKL